MRNWLVYARERARKERERLGGETGVLLLRLRESLVREYDLELVGVDSERFLQGSRGELVLAEGCLYYDRTLEQRPEELLEVLAHEYCHLLLHHEQFRAASQDLIRGSAFLNNGAAALSRYSPRSQYEAEASAFAAEFICPSRECFLRWRETEGLSAETLAGEFGATPSLLRLQLAEGLYESVAGEVESDTDKRLEPPVTSEQESAATALGIPVLVDAGPGTGKTKTLVRRVEYLVKEKGVEPEKILVLTFSNEAAGELQERLRTCLGDEAASRMAISTFHGFGVALLNTLGHHAGLGVDFSLLDETSQQELISELLGSVDCDSILNIKKPEETAAEATRSVNFLKDRLIGVAELRLAISAWTPTTDEQNEYARSQALLRIFDLYETEKAKRQQVDFADLIRMPHELLQANEKLREQVQSDFPWVLVDEYQDVSRATALLLRQICTTGNPPWVVGDARQAIYRFRGAAPENVRLFAKDFPGAVTFQLSENYRSCPEVIAVMNRMATWLEEGLQSGTEPERWKSGRAVSSHGTRPAVLAIANNDLAERRGVTEAVKQWLSEGIPPEQIGVLARRNVDVRNIAVELKSNGIRAVTSGLLTAEGAGGDLAAVLTVADHQQAVPRLVYALYRGKAPTELLNEVTRQLLAANMEDANMPDWSGGQRTRQLASDAWRIFHGLQSFVHSGDGWTVLCEFLFFVSSYTRELLAKCETHVESVVRLEEALSALSLAAGYRFAHPHVQPRRSRLGLAERMRDLITQSVPGVVPPRRQPGAVRVMTCHASKGLEFPCVAVVGQSLPEIRARSSFLPPSFRPDPNEDLLQAESLLFVGLSRAERCALISCARTASGKPRSTLRRMPSLLSKLGSSNSVPVVSWSAEPNGEEEVGISRIWGGDPPSGISTFSLSKNTCRVRTYLEEDLGARFRGRQRSLYPEFVSLVRRTLRRIVESAILSGKRVPESEAARIAEEEWPADRHKDHVHLPIYRPRLIRWASSFARAFDPQEFAGAQVKQEAFELTDGNGISRTVKLQLVAELEKSNGGHFAVALQVGRNGDSKHLVKWSELKDYERLPFVLLHERHGNVEPMVFFGEDGLLCSFQWSRTKPEQAIREQALSARDIAGAITSGKFQAKVDDWACDRCPCRMICPAWLGAQATETK